MSARAQPRPALAPAVLDHTRAAHRAHALHEPVDPASVALLGLVCPLDFSRPLFILLFSVGRVLPTLSPELAEYTKSYSRHVKPHVSFGAVWLPCDRRGPLLESRPGSGDGVPRPESRSKRLGTRRSNHSIHGLW